MGANTGNSGNLVQRQDSEQEDFDRRTGTNIKDSVFVHDSIAHSVLKDILTELKEIKLHLSAITDIEYDEKDLE